MEAQLEYAHIAYTFFARSAPIYMLSRCLLTKISAAELSRKSIKSALLVGSQIDLKVGSKKKGSCASLKVSQPHNLSFSPSI